jgi:hypothetical protein
MNMYSMMLLPLMREEMAAIVRRENSRLLAAAHSRAPPSGIATPYPVNT